MSSDSREHVIGILRKKIETITATVEAKDGMKDLLRFLETNRAQLSEGAEWYLWTMIDREE